MTHLFFSVTWLIENPDLQEELKSHFGCDKIPGAQLESEEVISDGDYIYFEKLFFGVCTLLFTWAIFLAFSYPCENEEGPGNFVMRVPQYARLVEIAELQNTVPVLESSRLILFPI